MRKNTITETRNELIQKLQHGIVSAGKKLTPELEARIIEMAFQKHPQAAHEAPVGYTPHVVLTKEEVIAAAMALGLKVEESTDVEKVEKTDKNTLTMAGDYKCESIVGDKIRESYTRKTSITDWSDSGDVILYRPAKTYAKDKAEAEIAQMLKEL